MRSNQQANDKIHEDRLLNVLVNAPDEEIALNLGANAEIDANDIHEVLVGACTDGTSVSKFYENSKDSPHENTVLYHLHAKFDIEGVERVGNVLLQKDVLEILPE